MTSAVVTTDRLRMSWSSARHGIYHTWYLHGPDGVVQFRAIRFTARPIFTLLTDVYQRFADDNSLWMGMDVGYHSPTPRYEGQEPFDTDCPVLGGMCFYDGSSLRASELLETLVYGPLDPRSWPWIWRELDAYYRKCFTEPGEFFASPVTMLVEACRRGARD